MSSRFCCSTSSRAVEGAAVVSSRDRRASASRPISGAPSGSTFFISTPLPRGDEWIAKWSIRRRAPVMPRPMPVAERYLPARMVSSSGIPLPWSRT